ARMVWRVIDRLGQQTVHGRHFVERGREQPVVDQPHPGGELAFDASHHHVEIIERAERIEPYDAASRRVRIDVIEARKALRILQVTEQRKTVAPVRRRCWRRLCRAGECLEHAGGGGGQRERADVQNASTSETHEWAPYR